MEKWKENLSHAVTDLVPQLNEGKVLENVISRHPKTIPKYYYDCKEGQYF